MPCKLCVKTRAPWGINFEPITLTHAKRSRHPPDDHFFFHFSKVMICATLSSPYCFVTYSITKSLLLSTQSRYRYQVVWVYPGFRKRSKERHSQEVNFCNVSFGLYANGILQQILYPDPTLHRVFCPV